MINLKNKLVRESIWSFLSKFSTFFLFFLINIYLARKLGVENYGEWSYFISLITILSVLSYSGLNASTKKFLAQYNETPTLKNVIKTGVRLRFIFSLLFSVALLIIYKPLLFFLGKSELESLFLLAIPIVFLSGFTEFFKEAFSGLHRVSYNLTINLIEYGLKAILVIIFFIFSASLISVIGSYIISLLVSGLFGFYILYFNFYNGLKGSKKNLKNEIIKYSFPLFFISIGFVISTEIDTLMIGHILGPEQVALYAVAKQIIVKLPHISTAIVMGIMPIFAKLRGKNKEDLKIKFFKILKLNTLLFSILILFILLFSDYFIPLIYGAQYSGAALPLKILTIYLFCFSTSIIFNGLLDYQGFAKKRAINLTIMIFFNIVLNLILIPKYGVVGSAIATSLAYIPYIVLNWFEVRKVFN